MTRCNTLYPRRPGMSSVFLLTLAVPLVLVVIMAPRAVAVRAVGLYKAKELKESGGREPHHECLGPVLHRAPPFPRLTPEGHSRRGTYCILPLIPGRPHELADLRITPQQLVLTRVEPQSLNGLFI